MDRLLAPLALVGLLALPAAVGCSRSGLSSGRPDAADHQPGSDAAGDATVGPETSDVTAGPETSDGETAADACAGDCRVDDCASCVGMCPGCPPGRSSVCGDGRLLAGEVCDDGNRTIGDGCSADCTAVETGFRCRVPGKRCLAICGDGLVVGGETCDDGNTTGGDGCSSACRVEPDPLVPVCGDGLATPDEECDCGDGFVPVPEWCLGPNGHTDYGDCTTSCTWGPFCGDGIANGPEQCDLGAKNGTVDGPDGCTLGCTTPHFCGDWIVDTHLGEECDLGERNGKRLDQQGNLSDAPDAFVWCRVDCTIAGA